MPTPNIGDELRERYPNKPFKSFEVEVTEYCSNCHPPAVKTWSYGPGSLESYTHDSTSIHHDATTMKSCHFDPVAIIAGCLAQNVAEKKGSIGTYWNDASHAVTRRYTAKVVYEAADDNRQESS